MRRRIFIVDDSLTVRMSLSGLLQDNGFETASAASLEEARRIMALESFALLILDVELPDGDGIDFLCELRSSARFGNIPVMLLSTRSEVGDRIRGLQRGADEYIGKPYDHSLVILRARELIARHGGSTGIRLLVIEDSLTYTAYITDLLRKEGYEVLTAVTGEKGLQIAGEVRPNAILVDNMLPGIAGPDVIRQIRQDVALRRTPTLLLTASPDPADEVRALHAGADSFLRKGQDPNVILACISVMLRSASAPQAMPTTRTMSASRLACITGGNAFSSRLKDIFEDRLEISFFTTYEEFLSSLETMPPDCVVIEVGYDLARAEQETRAVRSEPGLRDIPVLVIGTAPYGASLQTCVNAGADDYVSTENDLEIVAARITALLRRKQYEDENRSIREQLLRSDLIARSQQELALASSAKNEELRRMAEIAQQKAREAEEARREVQQLAESIPQMVWVADALGQMTYFNQRWYEHTGLSFAESSGFGWLNAVAENQREHVRETWVQTIVSKRTYSEEYQLQGRDQTCRWFLIRALPMCDAAGAVVRWFGTCTDIEERKITEEALRRSEKLAATGRLAAAIAHEINNPLEAVINLLFIARTVLPTSPGEAARYLVMADKELDRVAHISKKTLAFYRDTNNPRETDLCVLVREICGVYSSRAVSAQVQIYEQYDCSLRPSTLQGEIRQVISNLLANALDATPAGGAIHIRVHDAVHPRIGVKGIRILIADNGSGIPTALRSKLFQPFITTKQHRGTGLGLWVSSSIIERHQGTIRLRSRAEGSDTGTCMSIFLPEHTQIRVESDETAQLLKAVGRDLLGGR
jgi:PAS domain S-box-containing protein